MQSKFFPAVLFLHVFSMGVIIPVFSLVFLSKGLGLEQLAIVMGVMSFTVILLELPTGILADLWGKKRVFLLSVGFSCIGVVIILLGGSFAMLCLGMAATGMGRALSSGSLESLYIDDFVSKYGNSALPAVLTRLNILEPAGLAAGAALGGFLPGIGLSMALPFSSPYDSNLAVKLIVGLVTGMLTFIWIKEPSRVTSAGHDGAGPSFHLHLKRHLLESGRLIKSRPILGLIFISVFTAGFFLFTLETYWQPQFINLLPDKGNLWLLGILSFLYFGGALLGSLFAKELLKLSRIKSYYLFPIGRLALAFFLILLGYQMHLSGFILLFVLTYFALGLSNIPESVLLNSAVSNEFRASALSMSSLTLQLGGLSAAAVSAIMLKYTSVPFLWSASSILMIFSSLIFLLFNKKAPPPSGSGAIL